MFVSRFYYSGVACKYTMCDKRHKGTFPRHYAESRRMAIVIMQIMDYFFIKKLKQVIANQKMLLLFISLVIATLSVNETCGILNTTRYAAENNLSYDGRFVSSKTYCWDSRHIIEFNQTGVIANITNASLGTCICYDFPDNYTRCVTKGTDMQLLMGAFRNYEIIPFLMRVIDLFLE